MNIRENSAAWRALIEHQKKDFIDINIVDLFDSANAADATSANKDRFSQFSRHFDQLSVDFSKQKISEKTLALLIALAEEKGLSQAIKDLAGGEKVNSTEDRPALHAALRLPPEKSLIIEGQDINQAVQRELSQMEILVERLLSGHWRGFSGKPITDVVNLGVGGSDLGPLLVCHALDEYKTGASRAGSSRSDSSQAGSSQASEQDNKQSKVSNPLNVHFASTMDGSQISTLFKDLNPETTLFIVVSKSFTTIDTLSNAASAKAWLQAHCSNDALITKQHFIGISTSDSKMQQWGIAPEHRLKLWDWVGGRFSLWSTVGLSIALKIGMANFRELLAGAHALDEHFFSAGLSENLPVLLGLIGIWNTNFLDIPTHAVLPYDARLKYFPDYLTQLEMESNGKAVDHQGNPVNYQTCPVLLGEVGPNAQHAFYQLLHQGTRKVSSDFIAPMKRFDRIENKHQQSLAEQHLLTLANCFAQSRALMIGGSSAVANGENDDQNKAEHLLSKHKQYPGNQPSTTILIAELSPHSLGQLIALYEHKVFVMATIWQINPFDQWGVELGKIMAKETLNALHSDQSVDWFDESTNGLMSWIKK